MTKASLMTRNQKYEQSLKEKGLTKITLWVPEETKNDFWNMAKECCDLRGIYPVACREVKTGRLYFVK
jgi:hypothetical protein